MGCLAAVAIVIISFILTPFICQFIALIAAVIGLGL